MSNIGRINIGVCDECSGEPTAEGHDACIGTLSNVMNACCGHGGLNEPYVQFYSFDDTAKAGYSKNDVDAGNCIRGEKAKKYILANT